MPLSEYEQRVLNELERDLGTDPKLKSAMKHAHRSGGRLLAAGLGIFVGLGVILAGVIYQVPLLGIAGFALMAGSALWALSSGPTVTQSAGASEKKKGPQPKKGFMSRLDERFERRREQGDL